MRLLIDECRFFCYRVERREPPPSDAVSVEQETWAGIK